MIIVGIDPGTNKLGVSIVTVDDELKILSAYPLLIDARQLISNSLSGREPLIEVRVKLIFKYLKRILDVIDPEEFKCVAYEIPHYDGTSPNSYAALLNFIDKLKDFITSNYKVRMHGYRPTSIKGAIGANKKLKGEKTKDAVLRCAKDTPEIANAIPGKLDIYSDDAIDAVIIAYKHLKEAGR